MAKPRHKTLDYLLYLLCRVAAAFVTAADVRVLYPLARGLGYLLYLADGRHRELACRQIQQSFPQWSGQKVRRVALQSLQSIVMLGFETLLVPRLITPTRWATYIKLYRVRPLLGMLMESPRPVILLTGHFGNWEVAGYALATIGFKPVVVARPLDNPYLDQYLRDLRQRNGLRIIDKKGASANAADVLEDNGMLAFVADQDAGRKGLYVNFFGRPASTYRAIALLAIRYETPIAVTYTKRLDEPFTFEIGIARIITPDQWADKDDQVFWITETYTQELERIIRSDPGQYFGWAHRRWRLRPENSKQASSRLQPGTQNP
ncbi:MAG: lipid A biosynthesis acyltransferase [Planctomycetes bacterium]|nr:lipid A biosynthesis acyltransferase [Planctomycetota bacterium]